ncbi:MAG: 8-oxo-dGTP diphosphatase MutT [Myxococcales bacterium]
MLEQDGHYLITQRRPGGTLPLLWEFPGGRVEEGETDEAALARELREEMGIGVQVRGRVMQVNHSYSDYDIDFRVYRCKLVEGEIAHHRVHDHRWVLPTDLDKYQFPAADEKTLSLLLDLHH